MTIGMNKDINPMLRALKKPKNMGISLAASDLRSEIKYINPNDINPYKKQARVVFKDDSIRELASSIKSQGIIQPLQVIPSEKDLGKYEVVSGERRLRAAILLEMDKVPCIILDSKKDSELVSIIENVQRVDLNPLELAISLSDLTNKAKHGQKGEVALKLGVSPSFLSQHISVMKLPLDVREFLLKKEGLSLKYLLELIKIDDDEVIRDRVFNSNKKAVYRSMLKVSYDGNDFKFDLLNKNKITDNDRAKFKKALEDFLSTLS